MILGFGFGSFAIWARKCAAAFGALTLRESERFGRVENVRRLSLWMQESIVFVNRQWIVFAHFLASIARSACTAVYPKMEFI